METFIFLVAGAICIIGALGVVISSNPVHSALSLVATLFGVAVLFVAQEANFLAAVQVIVYAGAIVVLFLFVIMLLGVDRAESLEVEPIVGQRVAALIVGVAVFALPVAALASTSWEATGALSNLGRLSDGGPDIEALGEIVFTRYLLAFEVTSVLLVIAVVGAVLLSKKSPVRDELEIEGLYEPEPASDAAPEEATS
ncbi:NADH-quinone oxidoreductase subunit J family protein [Actinospongicola halichondriae]|uniref:NADH-quinone oxidoreductase subunit J family protein n=1 Tax=Actinospongicola halichondriae TaxID=3236844 RepID=UPI003D446DE1